MKKRLLMVALGGLVALPLVEGGFWLRDDGAFPHLNLYLADEDLGTRLAPNATTRLRVTTNDVTTVNTNDRGFRGAAWPALGADEVLVVGDSQVFGLGVEDDETFPARLAETTGRTVLNAGVPTYGPHEMSAVVDEVLAERSVTDVVIVVNILNDLFELGRPNAERHAVWDGWAVRSETAPEHVIGFPGRSWLMSRSHAVYALRGLLRGDVGSGPLPSEGSWEDLLTQGQQVTAEHVEAEVAFGEARGRRAEALKQNAERVLAAEGEVDEALVSTISGTWLDMHYLEIAKGDPGDIVEVPFAESSRSVAITADYIREAAKQRKQWEAQLREREAVERRDALTASRDGLRREPLQPLVVQSVLAPWLAELAASVEEGGATLTVVVLPVDVQVHQDEWAKYGAEPQDMRETHVLLDDVARDARAVGARTLVATRALRDAEPGAFLDADIHMSAKGHEALAGALAEVLQERAPLPRPEPGIPSGRTRIPEPQQWATAPEIVVRGSSRAGCWTLQIDEWLRVTCRDAPRNHPTDIEVDHPEARVVVTEEAATLVVPRTRDVTATFYWEKRSQVLNVTAERVWFEAPVSGGRALAVSEGDERLCKCHISVFQQEKCEEADTGFTPNEDSCVASCETLYGAWSTDCDYQFCDALLQCARGDVLAPPTCSVDEADVLGACRPLCAEDVPCQEGVCTAWMGARVCI